MKLIVELLSKSGKSFFLFPTLQYTEKYTCNVRNREPECTMSHKQTGNQNAQCLKTIYECFSYFTDVTTFNIKYSIIISSSVGDKKAT